jgi:S-DNA-T family DNA segregation ATPase FtsK/SpoIIIE
MAERKKTKKKKEGKTRWHEGLKEETKFSIWAVVFLGISLFLILSIFNKAGVAGKYTYLTVEFLFGKILFLAPAIFFFAAISLLIEQRPRLIIANSIGGLLLVLSVLAGSELIFGEKVGGYIGFLTAFPFLKLFDFWASLTLFSIAFIIGLLIMFNLHISLPRIKKKPKQQSLFAVEGGNITDASTQDFKEMKEGVKEEFALLPDEKKEKLEPTAVVQSAQLYQNQTQEDFRKERSKITQRFGKKVFQPPPLDILEDDKGRPSVGDIKANANIIKRTLENFGIEVEMNEVHIGPSITQYTLKPAEGVRLSKITSLNNDLALALANHPIRIEAPIPGRSLVGIEVPNRSASLVGLRSLLSEKEFQNSTTPLLWPLGRAVSGRPIYASLSKMPHLLIAGATGTGKSVAIHALIISLFYRHPPRELQLLLIDPKRIELTPYSDLPYLLAPVIVDAKKAIMALKWAAREMEKRYDILLEAGARNISSYHQKHDPQEMPFIVIVIDELADIMALYPRELEASIVRLAQMSRAVGIHLVVSTQRPSVDVITGLIKANITSRIAFQVASQVDSRTILDMAGAEKLLGNGDMLYLSGDASKPKRIQGSFVSEKEVKRVVDHLFKKYKDHQPHDLFFDQHGELEQASIFDKLDDDLNETFEDALYEKAKELVIEAGKASSSYLQRRLRIGYARAARLLDLLEERGIVGPQDGSKPRDVLVNKASNDDESYMNEPV